MNSNRAGSKPRSGRTAYRCKNLHVPAPAGRSSSPDPEHPFCTNHCRFSALSFHRDVVYYFSASMSDALVQPKGVGMKPKIKVGICGLGRAGRQMHIPELASYPDLFEITAGCDTAPDRLLDLPPAAARSPGGRTRHHRHPQCGPHAAGDSGAGGREIRGH